MSLVSCARRMPCLTRILPGVVLLAHLFTGSAHAVWFEATGQAAIHGNRDIARQNATQEAIKQALLFAGASVKSVQEMTDGLLKADRLEVRSAGEVRSIELIDEIYSDGYVTVSIRADIFPQETICKAADYQKSVVTSWFPLSNRQQATDGGIFAIGKVLPAKLQGLFDQSAHHALLDNIHPFKVNRRTSVSDITDLARMANAQYVLIGRIIDVSVEQVQSSSLAFWRSEPDIRHFAMQFHLYEGHNGSLVWEKDYVTQAPWEFDRFESVDVNSMRMWNSSYGKAILDLMANTTEDVDEVLSCKPAYGRVLHVGDERIQVNIGEREGVKAGDQLTLFQLSQYYDPKGALQFRYRLHPTHVVIEQVYADSASARSQDGSPLGNIQPNDFVARY